MPLLSPNDFFAAVYNVLAQKAANDGSVQPGQPQQAALPNTTQQQQQDVVLAGSRGQPADVEQTSSEPESYRLNLKDLIIPIVAGAIAGISPKAANAVNIAAGLYGDIQRLKSDREIKFRQISDKRLDRQRLDQALARISSGNLQGKDAALELLSAGIPANDIPKILQAMYGYSPDQAISIISSLPGGVSARIPLGGAGGEFSTSTTYQVGSPKTETVYDPATGETKIITVTPPQKVGDVPQVHITSMKGVPPNAADDAIKGRGESAPSAKSQKSQWKIITTIDPITGQPVYAQQNTVTGEIVTTNVAAPQPPAALPQNIAKTTADAIASLTRARVAAMESGDEATVRMIDAAIASILGRGGNVGPSPAMDPQREVEEYLRKKRATVGGVR